MSLLLDNCYKADQKTVRAVAAPSATDSYAPVSHADFIDMVLGTLDERGLEIDRMSFALANGKVNGIKNEGAKMFGEIILKGDSTADYLRAIGIRNSIDKSISANVCGGESVLVCGNMCFSGEFMVKRKHTNQIMNDLPDMIGDAVDAYRNGFADRDNQIKCWKDHTIDVKDVDHLLMSAFRANAIPAAQIPKVLNEYNNPHHPEFEGRNVWSLHNAFSEVHKGRNMDPNKLVDENIRLSRTFAELFPTAALLN